MGSRKRSSSSQPIRKRKKVKQTLAKVAERKEGRQQKLERKLAEADARLNAARLSAFSLPSSKTAPRSSSSISPKFTREDSIPDDRDADDEVSDDDDADDFEGNEEERENAYDILVDNLAKPLHIHELASQNSCASAPFSKLSTKSTVSKTEQVNKTMTGPHSKKETHHIDPKESTISSEHVGTLFKNAELENRAAAFRANTHFTFTLHAPAKQNTNLLSSPPPPYKTVAEWPRLRLSASSLSSEAFETLRIHSIQSTQPLSLGLQLKTLRRWQTHPTFEATIDGQIPSPLLRSIASTMRAFHDLLMCANVDPRTEDAVRSMYVAHCVSHVLRCRARVLRNNAALSEEHSEEHNNDYEGDIATVDPDDTAMRDRGFVRARVLIIVPMRNIAYDVVNEILLLAGGESGESDKKEKGTSQVLNRDRFEQEFAPEDDYSEDSDAMREMRGDSGGILRGGAGIRSKEKIASDHSRTFRGNVDDDFKLGISLSNKAIKLFSDFYESDFIIASPLGMRRSTAAKASGQDKHSRVMREKRKKVEDTEWQNGIDSKAEKRKKDENDNGFLSSIEICVVDGANVFSMQNWDTLQRTMGIVNNMPKCTRDTDFSRVREYFLDGLMSQFRQSIVLSRYRKSDLMALFRTFDNHAGKVQIVEVPREHGLMKDVKVEMLRQTFFKVPGVVTPVDVSEARLKFFFEHTLPAVRAMVDTQTLVVVPSYFDFVRVRNQMVTLEEEDVTFRFSSMCEYSRSKDVVRARSRLFDRSISIVVMTERFHFFYRHWIRGANTIVWFGLPENGQFYPEIVNMTEEEGGKGRQVQSLVLYDQFDAYTLERIVGPSRSRRMTSKQSRSTYLFV